MKKSAVILYGVLLFLGAVAFSPTQTLAISNYTIEEIYIPGSSWISPKSVNNSGQVVGNAYIGDAYHAFYWENGDMKALSAVMGDSIFFDNPSGVQKTYSNADLMKMWQKSRDSLSNVKVRMVAWQKLKSDKGHKFILTWYDEIDTYKTGKVDSVVMHDINTVDSVGKIVRYSQYRKPKLN